MDPHDLKIRRMNNAGTVIGGTGVVAAGNRGQVDIKLGTGRYELYCTLANHESLGMRAYLKVERNSP
jgi:uncharacterized cupredoxin-like copper-binding protein